MSDHCKFFFLRSKAVHSVPVGSDVQSRRIYEGAHLVNDEFKAQLNRKSLKYNWHDAQVTVLEGVMARGDRRIGKLIEEAYRLGCLFDSWTESFHNELWMQAFENTGIDLEFYNLRERSEDELFPWDFIDIGVSRKFLRKRMGTCHERNCDPELPDAVFRLWGSKIWRRCLL